MAINPEINRVQALILGGRTLLCALSVLTLLTSCASSESRQDTPRGNLNSSDTYSTPARGAEQSTDSDLASKQDEPRGPTLYMGTDRSLNMPPPREAIKLRGDAVSLNFERAPLSEVVDAILGDTLGLDYVVEHPIAGEVTLRTRSPIPRDQLLSILESLLRNNNVLMVRGPNDRFFVSGSPSMKSTAPRFDSEPDVGWSNVIVPLQYIGAKEMAEILKPVAREDSFVRVDSRRNLLILAGTQVQLEGWLDIVSTFDIDQLEGMSVGIFPLTNSTVADVFAELEAIISSPEGDTVSGIAGVIKVMPVERLNSILVVSPRAEYVKTVQQWVEKLDSVSDPESEPTLQMYAVKNGNAGQLAALLSQIYGGGSGASGGAGSKSQSVAPGLTMESSGGLGGSGGGSTMASMPSTGSSAPAGGSFQLGDNVKVVADNYNNALIVYAPPYEYRRIERILDQLDVVATQVLIEASIVEVTLVDGLEYGLEWTFKNGLGGGDVGTGLLDFGSGLSSQVPGFSYSIADSAGSVQAVLNALAEKSLINVISTPSIMVLDNHTAAIHVGDQQPIQSSSTVTNGGNVQNSISYKDTGVKLEVKPSVNDGGLVTMDVKQSVTDVGSVDAATGQRSFLERNVSSRVAVRSGESVVLGGLIRDNETTGKTGVPFLMDIPVIGNLFSTTSNRGTRTELLVFITPRVLEGEQDLRDINREMRARMRGLTHFEDLPVGFEEVEEE